MAIRLAIVGPGRVGQALGRRWVEQGVDLLGFVGRRPETVAAAVRFCGAGASLTPMAAAQAHVLVFAVGDPDLAPAIGTMAGASPRSCSLWLHTSGRHDEHVFVAVRGHGIRTGALHPVAPFPDALSGWRALERMPAVLSGDAAARRLLERLAILLGMTPLWSTGGDRVLYHAACALAANGLTALRSLVDQVFAVAGGLPPAAAAEVAAALMHAALRACDQRGAAAALSGPVLRGDAATLRAHRTALEAHCPAADPAYRALMRQALELARSRGLGDAVAQAVAATLAGGAPPA
ncbi:MAG: DUF2520 domain-containing protein [Planctomycetes bacterium]|nr:DUF2520 domain-containing protein [Planctomycetota bacterium]